MMLWGLYGPLNKVLYGFILLRYLILTNEPKSVIYLFVYSNIKGYNLHVQAFPPVMNAINLIETLK